MDKVIITIIVAIFGGVIGIKFKIPVGSLIGSMIAVAIYNIVTSKATIPKSFYMGAQIIVGGMIGLNFTFETVYGLKKLLLPSIVLVIGLTVFSLILGYIIYKVTGIDLITSLFSSAPGGLTEMVIISDSYGAYTPTVALLHLIRLVFVVTFIPIAIRLFTNLVN